MFFQHLEYFSTLNSAVEIQTDLMRTDEKNFELPFILLDEVYPGPSQSLFSCQVFAAGEKTPDRITVHMYNIEMNTDDYAPQFATHPSTVFSSVIKLPFKLDPLPKTHKKNRLSLYASIEGMLHKEDGTDRALLRVSTQTNGAKCDHAITYLLLHLQDNAVLDVFVSDSCGVCCMNNAGESLMRIEREDILNDL